MYAQNFSPRLNLITTAVLFLTSTSSFHGQEAVELKYSECFSPFKCGENIQNISYPFWGENRPSYCGLKGFELKCHNNNYATIDIGTDLDFRLLDIDQSTREIRIVRDDIGEDDANICLPIGSYTIPNKTVLGYNFATELIYLFYDCPPSLDVELPFGSAWDNFTCMKGGARSNGFYVDESSWRPDDSRMFNECKTEMVVPVLRTAFQELRNNVSMTMVELFKQGFVLDYIIDAVACSVCVNSSGLCGSDYEDSGKFQCICRDRAYPYLCPNRERKGALPMMIGIGFGAALTGISLICFIYYIRKLPNTSLTFFRRKTKIDRDVEAFIMQYGSSITKRYTYYDVRKITNSFKYELGKGGYGNVFKGKLPDGRGVAVKVLNVSKGKGEDFINEVASIGRTSHINVVTLLGFCYEGRKRALIYEFMPNGSLEKFIYGKISATTSQNLGRKKLYDIALGIARGLEYLHCGCNTRILHLDIKPHNILLDEDFSPKISDFGLAKLYTRKESIISTIEARGTIGYIAPEVFSRNFGGVSHKSDVYSYGMMILEMVGGRKNVDAGVIRTSEIYFPHWIYKRIELDEELDLVTEMTVEENEVARKMVIVGLWCIQTDPSQRPSITKVIEMLEGSISALEIPPKPYLCSPRRSASNSSRF